MVSQVVAIFLLLLGQPYPSLRLPGLVALWVVVVMAVLSGAEYFNRFWRDLFKVSPPGE
jgi:phosphatidylglycerophosphate synthase